MKRAIVFQNLPGDFLSDLLVVSIRRNARFGVAQGFKNSRAHLAGRLAGKRYGNYRLGRVDHRQQLEIALDEQFGFSRTGRSLDDERCRGV